ncbi:calcium/sodium antiporter [Oscillospiraceae bacterium CM]|nr:calcium/sodium antiporter [Oscillospiraceae bacterium CM]
MLIQLFLLMLGLVLIIRSADILVDSAAKLARRYGVSTFIIGISVIAFGTSAPELAVGIVSGISHTNQLTLGDVLGSNIANMALIAGLAAVIFPIRVHDSAVRREIPVLIAVSILLAALILTDGRLSRTEGILLLAAFGVYIFFIARDAKKSMQIHIDAEGDIDTDGDGNNLPPEPASAGNQSIVPKLWIFSLLSLCGLFIGGKLTVDSSTHLAEFLGLNQTLIGLTVVAIATSMPELITSIVAARKKEPDIVLGNCVGSNILNILLVLGLSGTISPIAVPGSLVFDFGVILFLTLTVFAVAALKKTLRRLTGIFLVTGYFAYIAVKVIGALG